jgi:hypothetical protein
VVLQGDGKVRWGNENRGTGTAMEACILGLGLGLCCRWMPGRKGKRDFDGGGVVRGQDRSDFSSL